MDFKNGARVSLFAFLSMIIFQAQANGYSAQKGCFLTRLSSVNSYLDIGFGQTIHSNLPTSRYKIQLSNVFFNNSLFQQKKVLGSHLFLGMGLLWFKPFIKDSSYFPYIDLGIQYDYANDQKTLIRHEIERSNLSEEFNGSSATAFTFTDQSLLANLKLALYRWHYVIPYIYTGLGTTAQQTHQKIASFSKNIEAKFNEIKQRTFTYQLGIGVDLPITDYFWLSLSYQLQNRDGLFFKYKLVGSSEKGIENLDKIDYYIKDMGITLDKIFKHFHFNDLNTQTIQVTARYVFG